MSYKFRRDKTSCTSYAWRKREREKSNFNFPSKVSFLWCNKKSTWVKSHCLLFSLSRLKMFVRASQYNNRETESNTESKRTGSLEWFSSETGHNEVGVEIFFLTVFSFLSTKKTFNRNDTNFYFLCLLHFFNYLRVNEKFLIHSLITSCM